ncbi:hypothetical protein [Streptomyces collinus]|uniref:hypothetical protein n=1 Tax=Streptomyces collinus TaxID=42684 RepID=UPI0033220CF7
MCEAYGHAVLGPLLETDRAATAVAAGHPGDVPRLRGFVGAHRPGAPPHADTVPHRIQRMEHFTGRDRLDLWAALLCR